MSLVLAVLLVAVALGRARGGSLERLGRLPLRGRRLVAGAVAVQVLGALAGGRAHAAGLLLGAALALAFLARNRGTRGTGLVGLGLVANALVVGLNGAMPVSAPAATRAGVDALPVVTGQDPRHELLDDGTRLPWLADVVPLPLPLLPQVVSPGDVLVASGAGQLVVLGMGRDGGRRPGGRRDGARGGGTGRRGLLPRRPPVVDAGRDWLRGGVRVD